MSSPHPSSAIAFSASAPVSSRTSAATRSPLDGAHVPVDRKRPSRRRARRAAQNPTASAAPAEDTTTSDWRAFRAHLLATHRLHLPAHHHVTATAPEPPASPSPLEPRDARATPHWAHALPNAEVGACLLTAPGHAWPDSFAHLRRAVILLTGVSPTSVCGLLLNRPTHFTVSTHASVLARVGAEFSPNRVMLGGDCSTGSLDVLHPFPQSVCSGAVDIIPGVSRGGFNAARSLVRDRGADASLFRFFVAYSKWTAESFQAELDKGAWNIAACSPSLLLSPDALKGDRLWHTINSHL